MDVEGPGSPPSAGAGQMQAIAFEEHLVRESTSGPIPSSRELASYAKVYPDAPAIIFEEFRAESAHRRRIEKEIVDGENRRADRGQIIAATVFILGLVAGSVLVGMGHDLAGASIVGADLVSGAAIFLRQSARTESPEPKASE